MVRKKIHNGEVSILESTEKNPACEVKPDSDRLV